MLNASQTLREPVGLGDDDGAAGLKKIRRET